MKARRDIATAEEWLAHRPKATDALINKGLNIIDRPTGHPPEESDTIPIGYVSPHPKLPAKAASLRRKR